MNIWHEVRACWLLLKPHVNNIKKKNLQEVLESEKIAHIFQIKR